MLLFVVLVSDTPVGAKRLSYYLKYGCGVYYLKNVRPFVSEPLNVTSTYFVDE